MNKIEYLSFNVSGERIKLKMKEDCQNAGKPSKYAMFLWIGSGWHFEPFDSIKALKARVKECLVKQKEYQKSGGTRGLCLYEIRPFYVTNYEEYKSEWEAENLYA